MSDLPDWLKDTDGDKTAATAPQSSSPAAKGDSELGDAVATTGRKSMELKSRPEPSPISQCCRWCMAIVSLLFFIIFVTSASFQSNDAGGSAIAWWLFYSLHAVLAALCFSLRCAKNLACIAKPVQFLATCMVIFSIVMMSISLKQLVEAHESNPGPDSERWNDKEEKSYEVAGAALGLISALYHVLMWHFCSGRGKAESKPETNDDNV
jgi:hypothetical protein